jgi:hypothetical protein
VPEQAEERLSVAPARARVTFFACVCLARAARVAPPGVRIIKLAVKRSPLPINAVLFRPAACKPALYMLACLSGTWGNAYVGRVAAVCVVNNACWANLSSDLLL